MDFIQLTNDVAAIFDVFNFEERKNSHDKAVEFIKALQDDDLEIRARQDKGSAGQTAQNSDYAAALRAVERFQAAAWIPYTIDGFVRFCQQRLNSEEPNCA